MLNPVVENNEAEFKRLSKRVDMAWPTLLLWLCGLLLWGLSTAAGVTGKLAYIWVFLLNGWATFLLFTVLHDASHRSISTRQWVNATLGQLSIMFLSPAPAFSMFRFIHMQHHRFTNEGSDVDPDHWVSQGPKYLLPFKWACIDLYYYAWYIPRLRQRSKKEQKEFTWAVLGLLAVLGGTLYLGWLDELFWYQFLPARLAAFALAFAFDYLPHHPHKVTAKQNPYQATNVRIGMEWLLTPVLLYQNYHLIHHLHPLVPFYRYLKIWRARQGLLLDKQASMVSALASRRISREEYLQE